MLLQIAYQDKATQTDLPMEEADVKDTQTDLMLQVFEQMKLVQERVITLTTKVTNVKVQVEHYKEKAISKDTVQEEHIKKLNLEGDDEKHLKTQITNKITVTAAGTDHEVETANSTVRRLSRRGKGMPPEFSDEAKEILSNKSSDLSYDGMVKTIRSCLTRNEVPIRRYTNVDLEKLQLKLNPKGRTQVAKGAISDVKFLPIADKRVIVVGDELGYFGLWNLDLEHHGVYLYRPHLSKLSAITIEPLSMSKIFTSSYDQRIMLLDVEKEAFDEIYQDIYAVYSLCHRWEDVNCVYFGDEVGELKIFDVRASTPSSSWRLHGEAINTIHCKPNDLNIIATSSADKTVSLWDLRSISSDDPKSLITIRHGGPIYSAYFSPSGGFLATTSSDNTIGLYGGENYEEKFLIPHNNLSGEYISTLRGIWGWDDSHVYVGKIQEKQKKHKRRDINVGKHGLHIISTIDKKVVRTLQSDDMPTVPYRLAAHPYIVGTLAGATGKAVPTNITPTVAPHPPEEPLSFKRSAHNGFPDYFYDLNYWNSIEAGAYTTTYREELKYYLRTLIENDRQRINALDC
ncbi:hypothetical protein FXO37_08395 [Capsicum annuum]|nr:hypothetical protein FXO37_08395 [Capsicum annuum]